VGRLVSRKGFDVALSAFASIVRRFRSARMIIAGDGPARPALERQAAGLGLTGFVDFIGWVMPEQVPALINTATLMIVPSRREPFGLTALEAAQMARPVVATRVGGLSEIVVHGQTGLLVEKESPDALAEAITTLLKHPETATQMGYAARSRAIEKFGWDRYVDAHVMLYRRLVQEAKSRQGTIKP
jgi:glycogen(starch) synthase